MKSLYGSFGALLTAMLFGLLLGEAVAANDNSFVDIFNGKDLSGWVPEGRQPTYVENGDEKQVWTIEDGVLACAGKGGGFLRYDKILKDAIIQVEYRMSRRCNSGLGIRGVKYNGSRNTRPSIAGYEVQILDDAGRKPGTHSSGSLYRYVAPKVNAAKPAGEWNVVEIELRGPKIKITLNGQTIHDLDQSEIEKIKDKPLSGYFSLQDHGRRIEFRNIRVKEL